MAEQKLNVRLSLKYDSYTNWMNSSLVLNKGEAAIAYIETGETQVVNGVSAPQTLIKIGDGVHTFKDLPFMSGLAADVYGWAKAAVKPEYQASEIKGLEDFIAGEIQDTNTTYKLEQDTNNKHIIRLYSKALGAEEWTQEAEITTADTVYDDTAVRGDITALQGLVGSDKVADQIGAAIAALKLSETYAAKSHTHTKSEITDFAHTHEMGEVNGLVDALAGKETAGEAAKVQGNLTTYIGTNDAALGALDARVVVVEGKAHEHSFDETVLNGITSTKVAAWDAAEQNAKDYADGKVAALKTDHIDPLAGRMTDAEGDISGLETALGELEEAHAQDMETMGGRIDGVQGNVDALAGKVGTVAEGSTIVGMIGAVDGKADQNAADIEGLEGRISTLENNPYDDEEVRGLIADNAEAIEALEGTHATDKAALEGAIALKADTTALEAEIKRAGEKEAELAASIKSNTDAIALLTNGVDPETVDGVNDLINYVNTHGTEVTGMKADIKQNADDIDALEGRMTTAEGALATVDSRIAAAIEAEELDKYALGTELDAVDERVAALEAIEVYTKEETNGLLAAKADASSVYTKEEANGLLSAKADTTTVNAALDLKANAADVYTKTDIDGKVGTINGEIAKKANQSDLEALQGTVGGLHNYDDTAVRGLISDNAKAIDEVEADIVEINTALGNKAEASVVTELAGTVASNKTACEQAVAGVQGEVDALEGEVAKKANDADLAAIAKTGNVADLIQTAGTYILLDCGTSAE